MCATIKNSHTCIKALRQFGYWGNGCRTFLRQQSKTPKLIIRIYVTLDTCQILVSGCSRKLWEVPLRQQSKTLRHVLRISGMTVIGGVGKLSIEKFMFLEINVRIYVSSKGLDFLYCPGVDLLGVALVPKTCATPKDSEGKPTDGFL